MSPGPHEIHPLVRPGSWWLLLILVLATPLVAAEKGSFGFRLNVKLGGTKSSLLLSFRVSTAVVQAVAPDSPAAAASVAPGDELVEVGDMVVPGCKGLQLKARLTPAAGTAVPMKFKRPNGEVYAVVLISTPPKPNATARQ